MTIIKLISKGIQQTIATLAGAKKQSFDAISIGSTVQPVVDVNIGDRKLLSGGCAGNSSVTIQVPSNKRWIIEKGYIKLVTDGTVADRYVNVWEYVSGVSLTGLTTSVAIAASNTKYMYFNGRVFGGVTIGNTSVNLLDHVFTDQIYIDVTAGVAGDALTYNFYIKEYDVVGKH